MTKAKVYASVWDALADTPEQAAHAPNSYSRLRPLRRRAAGPKPRLRTGAESPSPE